MKNKAKTDLNKMTKKSLLLHIENMKLNLENDHLETQKSNREMQDILAKYKDGTAENKLDAIRKAAGRLRYDMIKLDIPSGVKAKAMRLLDGFIDYL